MKKLFFYITIYYLRFFAKIALQVHRPIIIGVAGSVGKTSTKSAIYAVLKDYFSTKFTPGNSETGVPLGILGIESVDYSALGWLKILIITPFHILNLLKTQVLIVEMGIDEPFPPRNMEYLLTIVKPDISVNLNAYATHTMQFEQILTSEEAAYDDKKRLQVILKYYAKEDTKIIKQNNCKTAIYFQDDETLNREIESIKNNKANTTFIPYGKNIKKYKLIKYDLDLNKTRFEFLIDNQILNLDFQNYLLPIEYYEVFLPAIIIGKEYKLSHEQIKKALEKNFQIPKGRSSVFEGISNSLIIDSTYNASKNSVLAFLKLVNTLKNKFSKKLVFVFGDMRELGKETENEHTSLINEIKQSVDYLYLVGPSTKKYIYNYFVDNKKENTFLEIKHFTSATQLGKYLTKIMPKNAIVLLKGSQNNIYLEECCKLLLKNKSDTNKLCRQSMFWLNKKSYYFNKID